LSGTGSDVPANNNFNPSLELPLNPMPPAEPVPSDTAVDSELLADFADDEEVDSEVFDDDVDDEGPVAEKTITLSVVDGK
jgi:E3 ubiquitin-protein ligase TRIP12